MVVYQLPLFPVSFYFSREIRIRDGPCSRIPQGDLLISVLLCDLEWYGNPLFSTQ